MRRVRDPIPLGCIARERFTGFTGQVIRISHHLTGCQHGFLEPLKMVEGQIIPPHDFDISQLVKVENHPKEIKPRRILRPKIPLEALVKDTVTDVVGVVVVTVTALYGRPAYLIQPCGLTPKGEPIEMMLLEEGRVKLLRERFEDTFPGPAPTETATPEQSRSGIANIDQYRR